VSTLAYVVGPFSLGGGGGGPGLESRGRSLVQCPLSMQVRSCGEETKCYFIVRVNKALFKNVF
jgi:hypothetical protein